MNRHGTAVVTLPSDTDINITRVFDASGETVFAAWTTPEHVRRWWGSDEAPLTVCDIDLRVGGNWRYAMDLNNTEYAWHGTYQDIVAPTRLVSTEVFEGHERTAVRRHPQYLQRGGTITNRIVGRRDIACISLLEAFARHRGVSLRLHRCASVCDVHWNAAGGPIDDHADGDREGVAGGGEVESLGHAGDDESELHLGEREADAVPYPAAEGHPCLVGEGLLGGFEVEEPVGVEAEWVGPGGRVTAGEVGRPQYERALPDRVGPDGDVDGRLAG